LGWGKSPKIPENPRKSPKIPKPSLSQVWEETKKIPENPEKYRKILSLSEFNTDMFALGFAKTEVFGACVNDCVVL